MNAKIIFQVSLYVFSWHSICIFLALGVPSYGNAVCCSRRRQAPGNPTLEKQELHTKVMIDFFVCFYLGIPAHAPDLLSIHSREPLRPSSLYLTCGLHHPRLHLSYPLGGEEGNVKPNNVIRNSGHCLGGTCAAAP